MKDVFHSLEVIIEVLNLLQISNVRKTATQFWCFQSSVRKSTKKYIFLAYFESFKGNYKLFLQALTLHCFFLTLTTAFYMYNTIYPYLFLLFSNCVFILTFSFILFSPRNTFCNLLCLLKLHCKLSVTLWR